MFRWVAYVMAVVSTMTVVVIFHAPTTPHDMGGTHLRHTVRSSSSSSPASSKKAPPKLQPLGRAARGTTVPAPHTTLDPFRQYPRDLRKESSAEARAVVGAATTHRGERLGNRRTGGQGGTSSNTRSRHAEENTSSSDDDYDGAEKPMPSGGGRIHGGEAQGGGRKPFLTFHEGVASAANENAVRAEQALINAMAGGGGGGGVAPERNKGTEVKAAAEKPPLNKVGRAANDAVLAQDAAWKAVAARKGRRVRPEDRNMRSFRRH